MVLYNYPVIEREMIVMCEVKWFERGSIGERVLDAIEVLISGDEKRAYDRLVELGLSYDEIYDVFEAEGYSAP